MLIFCNCVAYSQQISQTNPSGVYWNFNYHGQSFRSPLNGYIRQIEVVLDMDPSRRLNLYLFNGADGGNIGTEEYVETNIPAQLGACQIKLSQLFKVKAGNDYTFIIGDAFDPDHETISIFASTANDYPYGELFFSPTWKDTFGHDDLYFQIWISQSIPTLPEWGLIIFGALLASLGGWLIWKK